MMDYYKVGELYMPNPQFVFVVGKTLPGSYTTQIMGPVLALEIGKYDPDRTSSTMTVFSFELNQKLTCFVADFVKFDPETNNVK